MTSPSKISHKYVLISKEVEAYQITEAAAKEISEGITPIWIRRVEISETGAILFTEDIAYKALFGNWVVKVSDSGKISGPSVQVYEDSVFRNKYEPAPEAPTFELSPDQRAAYKHLLSKNNLMDALAQIRVYKTKLYAGDVEVTMSAAQAVAAYRTPTFLEAAFQALLDLQDQTKFAIEHDNELKKARLQDKISFAHELLSNLNKYNSREAFSLLLESNIEQFLEQMEEFK